MKVLSERDLHSMIGVIFTNVFDEEVEIKAVYNNGEDGVYVAYEEKNTSLIYIVEYYGGEYATKLFCEKPKEEYFNIGDEIDEGVFLFAVEERREESVLCLALCVKLQRSYPYPYVRFRNPEHLKHVRGKGVPKSEIAKIYTYANN